ncbi:MAG: PKD domain-containing protein [Candidatus Bathyarchaeota archaeon]|nr:PKD domain-containing protein [Candidatus Bathyarchaeota archaeon]
MKWAIPIALLLLLLASSPLIAITHETPAPNEEKTTSTPPELTPTATSINAEKAIAEKARITQHKITAAELEQLKNSIGVYEPDQNYTQLVDGHGTGMRSPTDAEWQEIAATAYLVDSVDYKVGDGAPSAVDQSATPWFPPIGNQGSQGSCVAWSVGYYVKTFQEAQEHGWDLSGASWIGGYYGQPTVSYQNRIISPAFIYNLCNGGVDKGLTYVEAIQLVCSVGACSWEKMPYNLSTYTAWPSEAAWTEAALYRGNSSGIQYMSLSTSTGLDNLKNWIASGHLATISVDSDKYSALTSADMWTLDNYNNLNTNHANTIVGYDDSKNYTEGGTVHYGAFKIANSWGVGGGWENVPDGFYWISYEAMKQRVGFCMFYYDMVGYQPQLFATFRIDHPLRNECDIKIGLGNTTSPIATKSFSQYIDGGSYPFCQNNIVFDITELMNYVPTVLGRSFFLRVYDSGTSAVGSVAKFAVDHEDSPDAPRQTVQSTAVYLNVTLSLGKILINSSLSPSLLGQKVSVGSNVNLFFGNVKWSSTAFYLLVSRDNLYQVSAGDTAYSPTFNIADLNASAIVTYTSAAGSWQVGYNWVNGTVPISIAGGSYFFKASDPSVTEVAASDTSITVVGALQITPTSGPAGTAITINGYGFSASSSANLTYLNPITLKWVSIANNTAVDTTGHFTYSTVAPDLVQSQPAGDTPALFDAIFFQAQDNGDGAYCNATTPFNEFRRGLAQVGSMIAAGLYGNTTDLTATVQVAAGHPLTVAGKWFAPGSLTLRWDDADLDVAVADESGFFNKTLTVPATSTGTHTIIVLDANAEFLVMVTVLPSPLTSDNYDGLWHTSDFAITLTCADDGSGIGATYYRINNGPIKNVAVDGHPTITTEGANNILEYWSVDGAGIEELPHKILTQIKLDKTPPTGSLKINNGASYTGSSAVTLTLAVADTISGISQVRFSNDGVWDTEQWESPVSIKSWVLTSGDGLKTVFCQVRDNVGFVSTFSSSITLDTEKPVAHAQAVASGASVAFDAGECTDNEGVVSYVWDFGDGTTGTGKTATHTYTNPGTYTATLTIKDAAGNTATSSTTVTIQAEVIHELPSVWPLIIVVLTLSAAVIYRRKCKN